MKQWPATSRQELERLAAQRHGDPFQALAEVEERLAHAEDGPEVLGRLRWIQGLLLQELARWDEAIDAYGLAIRLSADHGSPDGEARARANLAVLLTQLGRTAEANDHLEAARLIAPPSAQGLVTFLAGVAQFRRGNHREACTHYERALPLLEAAGDLITMEVLRLNRGVSLIYLGEQESARRDLLAAEGAGVRHGLTILAAMAAHDLGFLDSRHGRLADALDAYDRAEQRYVQLSGRPRQMSVLHSDRAEVLLQAGLAADARASALLAIEHLGSDGNQADLLEAQLHLARACLASGDHHEAREVALSAARGFRSARRAPWVVQAAYVARQVEYRQDPGDRRSAWLLSRRFERMAADLTRQGWPVEGRDALVFAALAALEHDDLERAADLLNRVTRRRGRGAVPHRARFALARAMLLRAGGQVDQAAEAVRRGVADALEVLTVTGSTEARLEALRFAGELAELGTELALDRGRPVEVLRAVERQRSLASVVGPSPAVTGAGGGPVPVPSIDPAEVVPGIRGAGADGPSSDDEERIREWALRRPAGATAVRRRLRWPELRAATAGRHFVYFLDTGGLVRAVVVRGGETRVVELGPVAQVEEEVRFQLFAFERGASFGASARAWSAAARQSTRLDQLLIEPLGLGPGPLVVVPSPAVRDVRWSFLPTVAGRDLTLATSGLAWVEAQRRALIPPDPRVVLVSGPRLESRDQEVERIASMYRQVTVLTGARADRRTVIEHFGRADLVHIAAHGLFREENPMFSRLELADGGLTIHDLERVRTLPSLVVLSACEAAASRLYPSGGVLGTATALTALGARTVVAAVQPVADGAACELMVRFHRHLASGTRPARALRLAAADAAVAGERAVHLTASHFVTMGAD